MLHERRQKREFLLATWTVKYVILFRTVVNIDASQHGGPKRRIAILVPVPGQRYPSVELQHSPVGATSGVDVEDYMRECFEALATGWTIFFAGEMDLIVICEIRWGIEMFVAHFTHVVLFHVVIEFLVVKPDQTLSVVALTAYISTVIRGPIKRT
ncbi:hypothetical protein BU24DRAFT_428593 [Aaosphaeria arxii CBS 175.79]|uniref:Uncharacterized protein n=1 Tax=Aaosphaeria arxii CBS 175.79 TaxID=1450172 RepID=A0A6A5X9U0_9PLEO|nr:uncharacterized protein BU24DRAFT_428593 [Aaosphaeria arxii CBS 175.79]KAF2009703.1 hypothetical protein BU24DRAFT_428593 [Aaosphaeria arxii CBS 175.79]